MRSAEEQAFQRRLGERILLARKARGLSQQSLAEALGFKDRQILSNIEAGKRKVAADELLAFMRALGKDLDFFTDPYAGVEERAFSWRARQEEAARGYEPHAGRIVAAYRHFVELLNRPLNPLPHRLAIDRRDSFERAVQFGERVGSWLGFTPETASDLPDLIRKKLEIVVLFIDPPEGVSGAACRLSEFSAIMVNRNDPPWRRSFDIAHELFHLLTWDALPPARIEPAHYGANEGRREERLADSFAAGLVMPGGYVQPEWVSRESIEINDRIRSMAVTFGVSGEALFYRLKNLGVLSEAQIKAVVMTRLRRSPSDEPELATPRLYCESFVEMMHEVLTRGMVSARKIARVLGGTLEDLDDLFAAYGMETPC